MLSCKESAQLVSESMEHPLTVRQRVALGMHLLMCRFCSRYKKQIRLIREAIRRMAEEEDSCPASSETSLTPEARDRIKAAVEEQIDSK